jgi:hypothetical protein
VICCFKKGDTHRGRFTATKDVFENLNKISADDSKDLQTRSPMVGIGTGRQKIYLGRNVCCLNQFLF